MTVKVSVKLFYKTPYISPMKKNVDLYNLGLKSYQPVWDVQHKIQQQIIEEKRLDRINKLTTDRHNDTLLFVEHPHVYTLGKSGNQEHLLRSNLELKEIDAEFVKTNRGGDITYHGPGQIVGYPILDLDRHFTDIHKYLRFLEEVVIRVCAEYGIQAGRINDLTGVWVNNQKICAMGIRCSRWVTMHGFAFNVNTDLNYFDYIIPCGIHDKKVTSLHKLLGMELDLQSVQEKIAFHFENIFQVQLKPCGTWKDINKNFS